MSSILHRPAALLAAAVIVIAGCGTGSTASGPPGSVAPSAGADASPGASGRPSSPAVLTITQPASGSIVTGSTVHVAMMLTGATIVAATTTDIRPDQGHVHLYVDSVLTSMNYQLEQDLPVHPGTYVLKAEFVAADHAPFSPRVWSPEVFFTVR